MFDARRAGPYAANRATIASVVAGANQCEYVRSGNAEQK